MAEHQHQHQHQRRERDREIEVREEFGLRADQEWVDWVAAHGIDGGTIMILGIHLSEDEVADMRSRSERGTAIAEDLASARLASDAGLWIDQEAGGVVRVLLAHPDRDEQAFAEQIVAGRGGVVELVEK